MCLIMSIYSIYKGLFLHNYRQLPSLLITQLTHTASQACVAFECNLLVFCIFKHLKICELLR